ncbi:MAG: 4Fe-4S dicluster domain-containing protein, partial [Kiloniellales bacterium]|nr:4Fe-4S dicluster domain-containing protein [Kiloniellales bacterium]
AAGGERPLLLVHDRGHGWPIVEASARFGRGLPARALPFEVNEITQISLDFLLSGLALGAERILLLGNAAKRNDYAGLAEQLGMAEAIMTGLGYDSGLVNLLVEDDPDRVEEELYGTRDTPDRIAGDFLPQSQKRTNLRLAAAHLHHQAPDPQDLIPLAPGAPFGTVTVDTSGCTLCLACVSACPTSALGDNPDLPQLSFQEDACIQCGLCKNTCPENVIRLVPRFNLSKDVQERRVL